MLTTKQTEMSSSTSRGKLRLENFPANIFYIFNCCCFCYNSLRYSIDFNSAGGFSTILNNNVPYTITLSFQHRRQLHDGCDLSDVFRCSGTCFLVRCFDSSHPFINSVKRGSNQNKLRFKSGVNGSNRCQTWSNLGKPVSNLGQTKIKCRHT